VNTETYSQWAERVGTGGIVVHAVFVAMIALLLVTGIVQFFVQRSWKRRGIPTQKVWESFIG
jgi:hypothetical protein